jgi:hypothetical protein
MVKIDMDGVRTADRLKQRGYATLGWLVSSSGVGTCH